MRIKGQRADYPGFMLFAVLCAMTPVSVHGQTGPLFCPPETNNPPLNTRTHTGTGQIALGFTYVNDGFFITALGATLHNFGGLDNNAALENDGTLNNFGALNNNNIGGVVNIGTLD